MENQGDIVIAEKSLTAQKEYLTDFLICLAFNVLMVIGIVSANKYYSDQNLLVISILLCVCLLGYLMGGSLWFIDYIALRKLNREQIILKSDGKLYFTEKQKELPLSDFVMAFGEQRVRLFGRKDKTVRKYGTLKVTTLSGNTIKVRFVEDVTEVARRLEHLAFYPDEEITYNANP